MTRLILWLIVICVEIGWIVYLGFKLNKKRQDVELITSKISKLDKEVSTQKQQIKDNENIIKLQNDNLSNLKQIFKERELEQKEVFKNNCERNKKDYDEEYLNLMKEYTESF